ncbi:PTS lactose/cellobiose transporter subunit IIA [Seinonella peptonophila]|nr:PTS lactose/cellobiose transporter subunit IIA [Seinonella peptonophila]
MMSQPSTLAEISFQLILHAGDARSSAMEAIQAAKAGDYPAAKEKLAAAEESFRKAHHVQTGLLQQEAAGNEQAPSILLIHAQDHLMTSMTVKDLAQEFVELYQQISTK